MSENRSLVTNANLSKEKIMYLIQMAQEFEKRPNRKILDDKVAYVEKDYQTYQKYPLETIIKINKTKYSGVEFKFGIDFDGSKTVITMRDITEDISEVKDSSITTVTECNIHINKLGLSLICDNQHIRQKNEMYERNEICYITIDDIILYSRNELKDNINFS